MSFTAIFIVPTGSMQDVMALRERLQSELDLGITAAQDYCAALLHTSRRAWQQWERAERKMHPAFWELVQVKTRGRDQAL